MIEINKIYNENCLKTMQKMPNNFIDLTVTSPPYDNLRVYKDNIGLEWNFDKFKPIAKELYRVTKKGGVIVWVVGDATNKGTETGTSFKQALYFKECGFNLHDTMIWNKSNPFNFGSNNCYIQSFEYMFILSKDKPKSLNFIRDRKVKSTKSFKAISKDKSNNRHYNGKVVTPNKFGKRYNLWVYSVESGKKQHPAVFPEQLANDHIISWSDVDDIVYDPFGGSGTTAKMSILNNRRWIISEISNEYCEIIAKKIKGVYYEK